MLVSCAGAWPVFTATAQAEKVRTWLLAEVDAGRQPPTSAAVAQFMKRYLEVVHVEPSTRQRHEWPCSPAHRSGSRRLPVWGKSSCSGDVRSA
jgi:hypothetical protein